MPRRQEDNPWVEMERQQRQTAQQDRELWENIFGKQETQRTDRPKRRQDTGFQMPEAWKQMDTGDDAAARRERKHQQHERHPRHFLHRAVRRGVEQYMVQPFHGLKAWMGSTIAGSEARDMDPEDMSIRQRAGRAMHDWATERHGRSEERVARRFAPEIEGISEAIDSPGNFARWGAENIVELVPMGVRMAAEIFTGTAAVSRASAISRTVQRGRDIASRSGRTWTGQRRTKQIQDRLVKGGMRTKQAEREARRINERMNVSKAIGALSIGPATYTPSMYMEVLNEHEIENPASALAFGLGASAVTAVFPGQVQAVESILGRSKSKMFQQMLKNRDMRGAAGIILEGARHAPKAAVEEFGQESMALANLIWNDELLEAGEMLEEYYQNIGRPLESAATIGTATAGRGIAWEAGASRFRDPADPKALRTGKLDEEQSIMASQESVGADMKELDEKIQRQQKLIDRYGESGSRFFDIERIKQMQAENIKMREEKRQEMQGLSLEYTGHLPDSREMDQDTDFMQADETKQQAATDLATREVIAKAIDPGKHEGFRESLAELRNQDLPEMSKREKQNYLRRITDTIAKGLASPEGTEDVRQRINKKFGLNISKDNAFTTLKSIVKTAAREMNEYGQQDVEAMLYESEQQRRTADTMAAQGQRYEQQEEKKKAQDVSARGAERVEKELEQRRLYQDRSDKEVYDLAEQRGLDISKKSPDELRSELVALDDGETTTTQPEAQEKQTTSFEDALAAEEKGETTEAGQQEEQKSFEDTLERGETAETADTAENLSAMTNKQLDKKLQELGVQGRSKLKKKEDKVEGILDHQAKQEETAATEQQDTPAEQLDTPGEDITPAAEMSQEDLEYRAEELGIETQDLTHEELTARVDEAQAQPETPGERHIYDQMDLEQLRTTADDAGISLEVDRGDGTFRDKTETELRKELEARDSAIPEHKGKEAPPPKTTGAKKKSEAREGVHPYDGQREQAPLEPKKSPVQKSQRQLKKEEAEAHVSKAKSALGKAFEARKKKREEQKKKGTTQLHSGFIITDEEWQVMLPHIKEARDEFMKSLRPYWEFSRMVIRDFVGMHPGEPTLHAEVEERLRGMRADEMREHVQALDNDGLKKFAREQGLGPITDNILLDNTIQLWTTQKEGVTAETLGEGDAAQNRKFIEELLVSTERARARIAQIPAFLEHRGRVIFSPEYKTVVKERKYEHLSLKELQSMAKERGLPEQFTQTTAREAGRKRDKTHRELLISMHRALQANNKPMALSALENKYDKKTLSELQRDAAAEGVSLKTEDVREPQTHVAERDQVQPTREQIIDALADLDFTDLVETQTSELQMTRDQIEDIEAAAARTSRGEEWIAERSREHIQQNSYLGDSSEQWETREHREVKSMMENMLPDGATMKGMTKEARKAFRDMTDQAVAEVNRLDDILFDNRGAFRPRQTVLSRIFSEIKSTQDNPFSAVLSQQTLKELRNPNTYSHGKLNLAISQLLNQKRMAEEFAMQGTEVQYRFDAFDTMYPNGMHLPPNENIRRDRARYKKQFAAHYDTEDNVMRKVNRALRAELSLMGLTVEPSQEGGIVIKKGELPREADTLETVSKAFSDGSIGVNPQGMLVGLGDMRGTYNWRIPVTYSARYRQANIGKFNHPYHFQPDMSVGVHSVDEVTKTSLYSIEESARKRYKEQQARIRDTVNMLHADSTEESYVTYDGTRVSTVRTDIETGDPIIISRGEAYDIVNAYNRHLQKREQAYNDAFKKTSATLNRIYSMLNLSKKEEKQILKGQLSHKRRFEILRNRVMNFAFPDKKTEAMRREAEQVAEKLMDLTKGSLPREYRQKLMHMIGIDTAGTSNGGYINANMETLVPHMHVIIDDSVYELEANPLAREERVGVDAYIDRPYAWQANLVKGKDQDARKSHVINFGDQVEVANQLHHFFKNRLKPYYRQLLLEDEMNKWDQQNPSPQPAAIKIIPALDRNGKLQEVQRLRLIEDANRGAYMDVNIGTESTYSNLNRERLAQFKIMDQEIGKISAQIQSHSERIDTLRRQKEKDNFKIKKLQNAKAERKNKGFPRSPSQDKKLQKLLEKRKRGAADQEIGELSKKIEKLNKDLNKLEKKHQVLVDQRPEVPETDMYRYFGGQQTIWPGNMEAMSSLNPDFEASTVEQEIQSYLSSDISDDIKHQTHLEVESEAAPDLRMQDETGIFEETTETNVDDALIGWKFDLEQEDRVIKAYVHGEALAIRKRIGKGKEDQVVAELKKDPKIKARAQKAGANLDLYDDVDNLASAVSAGLWVDTTGLTRGQRAIHQRSRRAYAQWLRDEVHVLNNREYLKEVHSRAEANKDATEYTVDIYEHPDDTSFIYDDAYKGVRHIPDEALHRRAQNLGIKTEGLSREQIESKVIKKQKHEGTKQTQYDFETGKDTTVTLTEFPKGYFEWNRSDIYMSEALENVVNELEKNLVGEAETTDPKTGKKVKGHKGFDRIKFYTMGDPHNLRIKLEKTSSIYSRAKGHKIQKRDREWTIFIKQERRIGDEFEISPEPYNVITEADLQRLKEMEARREDVQIISEKVSSQIKGRARDVKVKFADGDVITFGVIPSGYARTFDEIAGLGGDGLYITENRMGMSVDEYAQLVEMEDRMATGVRQGFNKFHRLQAHVKFRTAMNKEDLPAPGQSKADILEAQNIIKKVSGRLVSGTHTFNNTVLVDTISEIEPHILQHVFLDPNLANLSKAFKGGDGRIYIIRDRHHDTNDMVLSYLHEAVAHHGLKAAFGRVKDISYDAFLDNVARQYEPQVQGILRRNAVQMDPNSTESKRRAAEEMVARIIENAEVDSQGRITSKEAGTYLDRIVAFITRQLRRTGLVKSLKDSDGNTLLTKAEIRNMAARAYKGVNVSYTMGIGRTFREIFDADTFQGIDEYIHFEDRWNDRMWTWLGDGFRSLRQFQNAMAREGVEMSDEMRTVDKADISKSSVGGHVEEMLDRVHLKELLDDMEKARLIEGDRTAPALDQYIHDLRKGVEPTVPAHTTKPQMDRIVERIKKLNMATLDHMEHHGLRPKHFIEVARNHPLFTPFPQTQDMKKTDNRQPWLAAVAKYQEVLVSSQKNEVKRRFMNLAQSLKRRNPKAFEDMFEEMHPDALELREDGLAEQADIVTAWIDGQRTHLRVKHKSLARSMNHLDPPEAAVVLDTIQKAHRVLAQALIRYNPHFWMVNLTREFATGTMHLYAGAEAKGMPKGTHWTVARNAVSGLRAINQYAKGTLKDEKRKNRMSAFIRDGGMTGYYTQAEQDKYMESAERLQAALARHTNTPTAAMLKHWDTFSDVVTRYNRAAENAMRFALYEHLLDNGWTEQRAVLAAKDMNVNFDRRGTNQTLNSMFLFFNASVQGMATTGHWLKQDPKKARRLLQGIVAGGFIMTELARYGLGEDDDGMDRFDKISEWTKNTSMIIPFLDDAARFLKIPLPYVFGYFYNLGRITNETARGGDPLVGAMNMAGNMGVNFNPVGSSVQINEQEDVLRWLTMSATPSVGRPVMEAFLNKNAYGSPVRWDDEATAWEDANTLFNHIVVRGWGGGATRFLFEDIPNTAHSITQGTYGLQEEHEKGTRRLVGGISRGDTRARFWEANEHIQELRRDHGSLKARLNRTRDPDKRRERQQDLRTFEQDNRLLLSGRMSSALDRARSRTGRDYGLMEATGDPFKKDKIAERIEQEQKRFLREFHDAMDRTI